MCSICRDLKPADCPGCQDNTSEDELDVMLAAVYDEMFRDIGEPVE